ncbi:MAG: MSMEG_0570 family nitrogen starvation response protein [Cyanobacteria bacterium J06600_6]
MPETNMQIEWSDGTQQDCYSPSLSIKKYFMANEEYELEEFVDKACIALNQASDRVKATFGYPCSKAMLQLEQIEHKAQEYKGLPESKVKILGFTDL